MVEVIDPLGSEIVLETRVGDLVITVARIDPKSDMKPGDTIALSALSEQLHFFDPESERAIR
ncbi:MAG: TOBE domain-containing protein [Pseudomonadota bacterium]|nr:TOBE domain-containing protein [Pseudomonadota bacterium]